MNEIQNIVNGQTAATMSSREIAELTGKEISNVHRDIRAMLDDLKKDDSFLNHPQEEKDSRGYTVCFHLNRELTDTLLTGYSAVLRRKVIARWRELEQQAQAFNPASLSRMDLIKIAMEAESERLALEDKVQAQQAQIAAAAPAVEFVCKYVRATGLMGFREVCKLLKANEARFREFLIVRQIMYRLGGVLTAYQHHTDAGRFEVRTGVADGTEHAYTSTKFTPKGIDWVAGEWAKYQLHNEQAHGAALAMN